MPWRGCSLIEPTDKGQWIVQLRRQDRWKTMDWGHETGYTALRTDRLATFRALATTGVAALIAVRYIAEMRIG